MNESTVGHEVQERVRHLATVRYGELRHIATFETPFADLRPNEKIVVRTERGTEAGTNLGLPWVLAKGTPEPEHRGRVLRRLNSRDTDELLAIQDRYQPSAMRFCKEKVKEQTLPMKLVSAEQLLGGEKLIFYFQSEGRVDFRRLVKDLAHEFKTRIEMRQIGARDEARILGDFGPCGRELCCRTHLTDLQAVSMKMVKSQSTTLDPNKITGRCGRLKCCLRYEDSTYSELKKTLPKRGTRVHTRKGRGEVINLDILAQAVVVMLATGERVRMPIAEVIGTLSEEEVREERAREVAAAERAAEREKKFEAKQARRQQAEHSRKGGGGPPRPIGEGEAPAPAAEGTGPAPAVDPPAAGHGDDRVEDAPTPPGPVGTDAQDSGGEDATRSE